MPRPQVKDLWASIRLGPLQVDMSADGHGYSPDLVNDLLKQLSESFVRALTAAIELNAWPSTLLEVELESEDGEADEESES